MIRLIAVAFALTLAGSVQAATPVAPLHQPTSMITQVAYGCGAGRTRVHGVCVARTTKRQVRRCVRWHGSTCARWSYWDNNQNLSHRCPLLRTAWRQTRRMTWELTTLVLGGIAAVVAVFLLIVWYHFSPPPPPS